MKIKVITLASGNENGWSWAIVCQIRDNGTFWQRGNLQYQSKEYKREYYIKHREHLREIQKIYRQNNKAKVNAITKNWQETHRAEIRKWNKEHKAERAKSWEKYVHTEKGKEERKRNRAKQYARRRGLGFIPLNSPFENTEAHHIDRDHVVYIPKKIHKEIRHSLDDKASMEKINTIALLYLPKLPVKKRKHSPKKQPK